MKVFELLGEIVIHNEEANAAIDETVEKAENSKTKLNTSLARIGTVSKKAAGVFASAAVAVGSAMFSLAENTRDYRTEMGKLDTAFTTNGHSSGAALETYKSLQAVLGETDQAVEAANHLAVLCDNQNELQKWTSICTGVYATFGASLPIEGLTESANETAKVGQVTGTLADALNWAGIGEDEFNKKLAACSTEQERQTLIMETLNSTYSAAAEQYQKTNEKVIESNKAHDNLNAAMAKLGDAAEPAITLVINAVAKLAEKATPVVQGITDAVLWLGDAWGTLKTKMTDITANVKVAIDDAVVSVEKFLGINNGSIEHGSKSGVPHGGGAGEGFANGLARVPYDNFPAFLHKDETVLNRADAREWRFAQAAGGMNVSNGRMESLLDNLNGLMRQVVANTGAGQNIMLDTGVLVGQLAPSMDMQLGSLASRRGRG